MSQQEPTSSNQTASANQGTHDSGDGKADAFAAIAIIAIVVSTVAFWLHSMPK